MLKVRDIFKTFYNGDIEITSNHNYRRRFNGGCKPEKSDRQKALKRSKAKAKNKLARKNRRVNND